MSIPALIVPILNRPDRLVEMLASIDHPIERTVIIDNGGVVPPDIEAIRLPHNIGVAASWNLGIKVTPTATWWLFASNDTTFGPGDLATIEEVVQPNEQGIWKAHDFSVFALTAPTVEALGWFDENFHPAYYEDNDVSIRAERLGIPVYVARTSIFHHGSSTIHSDDAYLSANDHTFGKNRHYFELKWGGLPFAETNPTPFNRGHQPAQPDLARLRDQAWPRSTKET